MLFCSNCFENFLKGSSCVVVKRWLNNITQLSTLSLKLENGFYFNK